MFVVTDFTKPEHPQYKATSAKEIKSLVMKITHDKKEANKSVELASEMGFGGKYECEKYRLEHISEYEYLWRKRWKRIIENIAQKDDVDYE